MTNKIHNAYDHLKADPNLKQSTLAFLKDQRQKQAAPAFLKDQPHKYRRQPWGALPKILVTVCVMLLFAVGIGSYTLLLNPVAFVSIDVNPSIELSLNRLDRVISATAYNDEGAMILEDLSVKGQKYSDAIDLIIESDAMNDYLGERAQLTFTVAADDPQKQEQLQTEIASCTSCQKHGGHSITANYGTASQAHHHNLSIGKYNAYLQLSQYDPTITIDDCRDMSMAKLQRLLRQYQKNDPLQTDDDPLQADNDTLQAESNALQTDRETPQTNNHGGNQGHRGWGAGHHR